MIKSISYNQQEIIKNILKLHCKEDGKIIDPTYSKGVFYKKTGIQLAFKSDIDPKQEDTVAADCRALPLQYESVDTVVFDPPFIISYGPSLATKKKGSNMTSNRFGCFKSMPELLEFYRDSMAEFNRVLSEDGILIFKCQDTVSSGKQYITHAKVIEMAEQLGFYVKDLFVLLAKSRLTSSKHKNQQHARKFHSYFLVLQKKKDAYFERMQLLTGRIEEICNNADFAVTAPIEVVSEELDLQGTGSSKLEHGVYRDTRYVK